MSNYTITTNFGAKDSLPSGNAGKVIKGSEFTTEFTNIQTAVATKANIVSPTFTGAVTFDAAVTVNSTATITGDLAVDTNTLFVDVSENKVGIGTASPTHQLVVQRSDATLGNASIGFHPEYESGGGSYIRWGGSAVAGGILRFLGVNDNERMRIDASGRVGIGATSPQNTLTVGALETSSIVQDATVGIKSNANHKGIVLQENSGAEQWSMGVGEGGSLKFYDSDSATPAVTFADISGNVGIGTDDPQRKLHVQDGDIRIESAFPRLYLTDTDHNSDYSIINSNGKFIIYDDTNASNRMVIANTSGNVGIGSDSPTGDLTIGRNGNASGGNIMLGSATNNTNKYGVITSASYNSSTDTEGFAAIATQGTSGTNLVTIGGGIGEVDSATQVRLYTSSASGTRTGTERMRIDSSGNLLVGTASPTPYNLTSGSGICWGGSADRPNSIARESIAACLILNKTGTQSGSTQIQEFRYNGSGVGNIAISNTAVALNSTSDERLKENITDSADAGSKVDAIQIRQFDWKADGTHQDYGVIAQELVEVAPEAVHQPVDEEDMMGVDYSKLVPMLIKEVQSLRSRVAELENV
jgi:hypothetical protein